MPAELAPTLGPYVVRFIEQNCVFGPGERFGEPAELRPDQKATIYRWYELNPDGSRRWRRAVRGRAKGDGKTQLVAWVAVAEMCGPVRFAGWDEKGRPRARRVKSPEIPIGAASWDQANLLFGAARAAIEGDPSSDTPGPLAAFFDCFDTEIVFKDGRPGRMFRVAAVAATTDGLRPSFAALDETHEFTGNKISYHNRIRQGVNKRPDAWLLECTTAGRRNAGSVAEAAWELGRTIDAGAADHGVLVDWAEAASHWDLDVPEELEAAIREGNPMAELQPWLVENLIAAYHDPTVLSSDFRRFHLNQWVAVDDDSWLSEHPSAWDECGVPGFEIELGASVWATVDVSLHSDTTALTWISQLEDGRWAAQTQIWEPSDGRPVDHADVMQAIRELSKSHQLMVCGYDPRFWEIPAQMLADEGYPILEFPQSQERLVPACGHMYDLIVNRRIVHPADPAFTDAVTSAVRRTAERGWTLSKGRSRRHIDACVALVMAGWLAAQLPNGTVTEQRAHRVRSFRGI